MSNKRIHQPRSHSLEESREMVSKAARMVGRSLTLAFPEKRGDDIKWMTATESMLSLWKSSSIDWVLLAEQESDLIGICLEEILLYSAELMMNNEKE